MLKVKEILHSQFRYVFPDLVKKDILTIDEAKWHDGSDPDNYYHLSKCYQGIIHNIPAEVTVENLDLVKPQLNMIYNSIYRQIDKDSKYYDSFNFIVVRHDFETDIFTDFATETKHLTIRLRLQFVDVVGAPNYICKVLYQPQTED
ncbi:MAG TPA: hypothetical protein PKL04_00900 [Methanofastidiosum sp.]|nr:hypothetical protein [Methanofastidiosum sp.]